MKIDVKKTTIHVFVWLIFIFFHFKFIPKPETFKPIQTLLNQTPKNPPISSLVLVFTLLIAFYYFNIYILIPTYLARQKIGQYALSVCAYLVVFFCLVSLSIFFSVGNMFHPLGFYINTLLLFSIVFIASSTGNIIIRWYTSEKNKKEIEHQKTLAELAFLKAQINPHFLFNTLNNIYWLAMQKSEKTPDAIIKLSSMMRYVLNEAKQDTVALENEIEYINKYIDLQKMRFTNEVKIDYVLSGYYHALKIAPLLLIPYIENAFKFGVGTQGESTICIFIAVDDGKLILTTSNKINNKDNIVEESNGIGLANTKQRLNLFYANKYSLLVNAEEDIYKVQLEINLN